jgi:hypothetical protein
MHDEMFHRRAKMPGGNSFITVTQMALYKRVSRE